LPRLSPAGGRLYLFLPTEFAAAKVWDGFAEYPLAGNRHLHLEVAPGGLEAVLKRLGSLLSRPEREQVRTLFKDTPGEPGIADLASVTSLSELIARSEGDWLLALMQAGRMTSYFQPIVEAANPSRIFAQEALLRGRDEAGELVPPIRMFDAARDAGLLVQLDQRARFTAVTEAARARLQQTLFMNLNPAAINDPASCLQATLRQIDAFGLSRDRVVFEIVETDRARRPEDLAALRDYCRSEGVRIALDDFGAGYASVTLLPLLRPDFVKLDRELVRDVHADPYKASIVARLLDLCRSLGIRTVAEGIELEAELDWFRAHGADLAQGFLFARPAPLPTPTLASRSLA
jgi:EAL domain-containing protein (putative c-di-GMP-specific phosphodiesterase class I)